MWEENMLKLNLQFFFFLMAFTAFLLCLLQKYTWTVLYNTEKMKEWKSDKVFLEHVHMRVLLGVFTRLSVVLFSCKKRFYSSLLSTTQICLPLCLPSLPFVLALGSSVTPQGSLFILDSNASGGSGRKYLFLCISTSLWSSVMCQEGPTDTHFFKWT